MSCPENSADAPAEKNKRRRGRPPMRGDKKIGTSIHLTPIVWHFIDHSGALEGRSRNEKLERHIRNMPKFRRWLSELMEAAE